MDNLKTLLIQQLLQVYGPTLTVYDEPIRQGLKTPAFLVLIINDSAARKLHRVSEWEYLINVTYFPSDDLVFYTEADQVFQKFKEEFRYIGNQFHVNKLDGAKQDGALAITFTVKKLVREIVQESKMNNLIYGGATSE